MGSMGSMGSIWDPCGTWRIASCSTNNSRRVRSSPQAAALSSSSCPAEEKWDFDHGSKMAIPNETSMAYLVANYPRIVSGLVHPSFLSGLTLQTSHL